jgi:MscS family membrane protein
MLIRRLERWSIPLWLFLCVVGIGWALWSSAVAQDTATPDPAAPPATGTATATNSGPPNLLQPIASVLPAGDFIASHQDTLSFGLNRVASLQKTFLGIPRWQYVSTLLYIALAFVVSTLLDTLIKTRLKGWATKTETQWDDILVGLADGPVRVISFVIFLHIGLQLFAWPPAAERYVSHLTVIMVALSVLYVLLKSVDAVISIWRSRLAEDGDKAFNNSFLLLIGKGIKIFIGVVAIFTLVQNLGINITALLGSVSILGLALGLAAQDTVSNLFGAVAVFLDRPFKVGDRIRIGTDIDGTVEAMGLRSTRVRTLEGFLVTVPNRQTGSNTVTNISMRPTIRGNLDFGITYDTPADRVKLAADILRELFGAHPKTADTIIHFSRYGDYFLNLNVLWWCKAKDWREYTVALEEVHLQIKERFDAEGLQFAFPTRTIHIEKKD